MPDLVPFAQFKKHVKKNPWMSVTFSKVAGFSITNNSVQKGRVCKESLKVFDLFFQMFHPCFLEFWTSIWDGLPDLYHLYSFKNVKNTHGGMILLVKLQSSVYNFTKSYTPSWMFFTFFKLYKWYQIAQCITCCWRVFVTVSFIPSWDLLVQSQQYKHQNNV